MPILISSAVVCILLILACPVFIIIKKTKKQQGELMRLSETAFTALLGGMMIATGLFLLYAKYVDPAAAGTDMNSYIFVGCFAVMSAACGSGIMFYAFIKKIIACEDRVIYINILGLRKELYWDEITEVKVPLMSSKLTLSGKGLSFTAGGESKAYKEFIKIARKKIKTASGSEILESLADRLMI